MEIVMHWVHLLGAVALVGGTLFVTRVLHPSLNAVDDDVRATLMPQVSTRTRRIVHLAVGLLLLTGMHKVVKVLKAAEELPSLYMTLIAIKVVLVLAAFAIAILVTLKPGRLPGMDPHRGKMMSTALLLGVAILFLSAYMRNLSGAVLQ